MKKILVPLPREGCDPSEVAIPWLLLTAAGFTLVFATPDGNAARSDQHMLTGQGLGLLAGVLAARKDARSAWAQMASTAGFLQPLRWDEINSDEYVGLLLPGGHAKSVREYLESSVLQTLVADFFVAQKPVAAVCHGVVLAARSRHPETGLSVLQGYRTTALLAQQELLAYQLTRLWMGDYYLTYPGLTVQAEVSAALADNNHFLPGPTPVLRDSAKNLKLGFCVVDRHYVSARWPGDLYTFTQAFLQILTA